MDKGPSCYPPPYGNQQGMHNTGYAGPENTQNAGGHTQNPGYPNPGYPENTQNAGGHTQISGYPNQCLDTKSMSGYPTQNPGYASGPGQVYTTTAPPYYAGGVPIMVACTAPLGPHSSTVMCPQCKVTVTSKVRREPGMLAWLSCGFLAIIGCVFGCCLIPFCIDECQDVHHTCPQCQTYLGKYSRIR